MPAAETGGGHRLRLLLADDNQRTVFSLAKIDLITGILGAGKTTFLRGYVEYLLAQGQRVAVLLNDFGAVNIDMMLLRDLQSERCEVVMIVGCSDPQSHRRRLRTQLIALGMQHFDRVVMEPSGLFDMDEFFDTLFEPPLDRWFETGSVLTVADAELSGELSPQMRYLLASQAACCGRLILSKLSNIPETPEQAAERMLAQINEGLAAISCDRRITAAEITAKEFSAFTAEDYAAFASAGCRHASYVKQYSTETLGSGVSYYLHIRIPQTEILPTVRAIMGDPECGTIYRIKGSLPAEDGGWLKLNAVPGNIELAPVGQGQGVLIVIGDRLRRAAIDAHLKAVNTDPDYVSVDMVPHHHT